MKYIFLFLLCFPCVQALAVTPTEIFLNQENSAEIYLYNTQNKTMNFEIGGIYKENLSLDPYESRKIELPAQETKFGSSLYIKEIYPEGFANVIEIPVEYIPKGFPESKNRKISAGSLLTAVSVLTLLSLGIFSWKRKKKLQKL